MIYKVEGNLPKQRCTIFIYSLVCSFVRSFVCSFALTFVLSFVYSFIHCSNLSKVFQCWAGGLKNLLVFLSCSLRSKRFRSIGFCAGFKHFFSLWTRETQNWGERKTSVALAPIFAPPKSENCLERAENQRKRLLRRKPIGGGFSFCHWEQNHCNIFEVGSKKFVAYLFH